MAEERVRFQMRIDPDTDRKIKVAMPLVNARSQNEFVEKALRFYCDYLTAQDCTEVLPSAHLSCAISSTTAKTASAVCCSSWRWNRIWYEVYAEPHIRPNTKEYYINYIENHIVPGIGKIMLDKLTTIQIQRFYNNLQKNGGVQRKGFPELKDKSLSPRVVCGVHTLLSNCLGAADSGESGAGM